MPNLLETQRKFTINIQSIYVQGSINQRALKCYKYPPPFKAISFFADRTLHIIIIDLYLIGHAVQSGKTLYGREVQAIERRVLKRSPTILATIITLAIGS